MQALGVSVPPIGVGVPSMQMQALGVSVQPIGVGVPSMPHGRMIAVFGRLPDITGWVAAFKP